MRGMTRDRNVGEQCPDLMTALEIAEIDIQIDHLRESLQLPCGQQKEQQIFAMRADRIETKGHRIDGVYTQTG